MRGTFPAEAPAQVCGSDSNASVGEGSTSTTEPVRRLAGLAFAGRAEAGMAFAGTSGGFARGVLELTLAEDPPAAAVEELTTAEALLCAATRAPISLAPSHVPRQAASGFCQSGAKRCRP